MQRYNQDYQKLAAAPPPQTGAEFLQAILPLLTPHQIDLIRALLTPQGQMPAAGPTDMAGAAGGAPAAPPGASAGAAASPAAAPMGGPAPATKPGAQPPATGMPMRIGAPGSPKISP